MKKLMAIVFLGAAVFLGIYKSGIFEQNTTAEQTATSAQISETSTAAETEPTTTTMVKIGKEDSDLYSDEALTTQLALVNGGELTEYISETDDVYKIKTNDGDTGYLPKSSGEKVTKTTQSVPDSLSGAVIVLDPGHGGEDTGALSNDELTEEKEVTLSTAEKVKSALEAAGATVYLTRTTDELVQLGDICTYSEEKEADVFISLHADSTEYANEATGITTYYYYGEEETLAQTIQESFTSLPLDSRGIAYGNYQVLRENLQPSILIEMGYMNNDNDLSELVSDSYQEQLAESITTGLTNYFANQA
ncbi:MULTISPECIES: N-acetylmuramoyl-L-alanine amidase family protein [unclassified Enterococcus]|jgi:N-acetylmuramoyl-L-alanine amidase|uniref:N-acetylmuramoyl-L-alanine amidase family protein n=1 Tax=unclassified Enterococcus TaxID=2608891 RepID=UPI003D2A9309